MFVAIAIAALGGLMLGSFLNVVAYRLPRGESIVSPGSHCTSCDVAIRPWDNVPVVSWVVLRGHCRDCGDSISGRYAVTEAVTAVLFAAVTAVHYDDVAQLVLGLVLVTFLVPLTLIDLDTMTLPDRLTAPAALVGLALGIGLDPDGEIERLIAAVAGGAFFFVAWYLRPGGMGFGDVKLVAVLGLFLGRGLVVAVFAALIVGVIVGLVIMRRQGVARGRKTKVPFGPFLALGGVVALVIGAPLVDAYLKTF